MNRPGTVGERLLALFALGLLLFNPPLLSVFSVDATLFGIPMLFIYILASWGLLIALVAMIVNRYGTAVDSDVDDSGQNRAPGEDG